MAPDIGAFFCSNSGSQTVKSGTNLAKNWEHKIQMGKIWPSFFFSFFGGGWVFTSWKKTLWNNPLSWGEVESLEFQWCSDSIITSGKLWMRNFKLLQAWVIYSTLHHPLLAPFMTQTFISPVTSTIVWADSIFVQESDLCFTNQRQENAISNLVCCPRPETGIPRLLLGSPDLKIWRRVILVEKNPIIPSASQVLSAVKKSLIPSGWKRLPLFPRRLPGVISSPNLWRAETGWLRSP